LTSIKRQAVWRATAGDTLISIKCQVASWCAEKSNDRRQPSLGTRRWKKKLEEIVSWERFDPAQHKTLAQIDEWVRETRHKVMYRDESKVD